MTWTTQHNWRWCSKCQGLWFSGNSSRSRCPAGGTHVATGSGNYSLVQKANSIPGQSNWRWCSKCQGLWFAGNSSQGRCPAGGTHIRTGSGNYTLAVQSGGGQTNWRWCSKCQGLWFASDPSRSNCPAGGNHIRDGSGDYHLVKVSTSIRVHVKVLVNPDIQLETMFHNMRDVFANNEIDIEWKSIETLNLPLLEDVELEIGFGVFCVGGLISAEQDQLFSNRRNVGTDELVIYFVRDTIPPTNGCASHPFGRPGAIVTQGATGWTLAHEIGHVLGLNHIDDNRRLMTGNGTNNIINPPPNLIASEIRTMIDSSLTINV